ncbi:MAG: winged helix-turn-helix transcriptional regulator [Planctomycetaceae bacterium]|nr:winged helix-turn-helix transcriptional regulator [Planctomycetaceae bacterium]
MLIGTFQLIKPSRECREMAVLAEIEKSASVSQRSLARAAGVSATMINAYVDDLVGRGLLDVTGETNRTYRYHLTDSGRSRREEIFRKLSGEIFELYAQLKHELKAVADEEMARRLTDLEQGPIEAQSA